MTKTFSLIAITVLALTLTGCQKTQAPTTSEPSTTQNESKQSGDNIDKSGKNLADIAAEVTGGAAYSCTFNNPETKQQMTYHLQGKKMAMSFEAQTAGSPMSKMVNDGTMIYMWDPATKKGMKLKAMTPEELKQTAAQTGQSSTPEIPDLSKPEEVAKLQQQYQINCTPSAAGAAVFQVPTDVEFQDLSQVVEMMKKYQAP